MVEEGKKHSWYYKLFFAPVLVPVSKAGRVCMNREGYSVGIDALVV